MTRIGSWTPIRVGANAPYLVRYPPSSLRAVQGVEVFFHFIPPSVFGPYGRLPLRSPIWMSMFMPLHRPMSWHPFESSEATDSCGVDFSDVIGLLIFIYNIYDFGKEYKFYNTYTGTSSICITQKQVYSYKMWPGWKINRWTVGFLSILIKPVSLLWPQKMKADSMWFTLTIQKPFPFFLTLKWYGGVLFAALLKLWAIKISK